MKRINLLKVLIITIITIMIIVLIINIRKTYSKYESKADTKKEMDVAFFITDTSYREQNIVLEDIKPSDNAYQFTFTVSNHDNNKRVETSMEYELVLLATTNLPLTYKVEKDGNECYVEESLIQDEDKTYYKKIIIPSGKNQMQFGFTADETHTFKLYVTFPMTYKKNYQLADIVENVRLQLNATQTI